MYYCITVYLHTGWNSLKSEAPHCTETALSHPSLYAPLNSRLRNLTSLGQGQRYKLTTAVLWDSLCGAFVSIELLMTMLICGFQERQTVCCRLSQLTISHMSNKLLSLMASIVRFAHTRGCMRQPNDYRLVCVSWRNLISYENNWLDKRVSQLNGINS